MGSGRLSTLLSHSRQHGRSPGYSALTFPLTPFGSTSRRCVQELGFASLGPLTPPCRLYPLPLRQASVLPTASSRFHLAMDTLAVRLTLPLGGRVEDFHLQVSAPGRAHRPEDLASSQPFLLSGLYQHSFLLNPSNPSAPLPKRKRLDGSGAG
jgi:hypothetical protein